MPSSVGHVEVIVDGRRVVVMTQFPTLAQHCMSETWEGHLLFGLVSCVYLPVKHAWLPFEDSKYERRTSGSLVRTLYGVVHDSFNKLTESLYIQLHIGRSKFGAVCVLGCTYGIVDDS